MFQHVLVPLDGSALAERVLPHVVALAAAFRAEVTVLRVLDAAREPWEVVEGSDWAIRRAEASAYLAGIADHLIAAGVSADAVVADGRSAESILLHAREYPVDLVVLTSHGEGGLSEFSLCGTAHKIASHLATSVFLVPIRDESPPPHTHEPYDRIAVTVDCSQRAEAGIRIALQIARGCGASVRLLHVVPVPGLPSQVALTSEDLHLSEQVVARNLRVGRAYLEQAVLRYSGGGVDVDARFGVARDIVGELARLVESEDVDLVVIGAHGGDAVRGARAGFVARGLMSTVCRPILVFQDQPAPTRGRMAVARPTDRRAPCRHGSHGD